MLKSIINKISGLQPAALSKKRLRNRCFPVKLLRRRFSVEYLGRLLLEGHKILPKTVPIAIPKDFGQAYH